MSKGLFGLFKPDVEKMRRRRDLNGLIRSLQYEDKNDSVSAQVIRIKAARALGEIGDASAVEPLTQALDEEDSHFLSVAVEALRKIGDMRSIHPLIKIAKHKNSTIRSAALRALCEIGGARAFEPLLQALGDDDASIRHFAADALGRMGDTRAIEPLIQTLNDKYGILRCQVTYFHEKLGWNPDNKQEEAGYLAAKERGYDLSRSGEPAVTSLLRALRTTRKDEMDLGPVVEALGEIGDARATEPLEHAWNLTQSPDLREKIEAALKNIDAKKSRTC